MLDTHCPPWLPVHPFLSLTPCPVACMCVSSATIKAEVAVSCVAWPRVPPVNTDRLAVGQPSVNSQDRTGRMITAHRGVRFCPLEHMPATAFLVAWTGKSEVLIPGLLGQSATV